MALTISRAAIAFLLLTTSVFAQQVATKPEWTLDLSRMSIPEAQAIGRIHGRDFRLDTATIEEGRLWLQQGKDRCDLAVDIPLCLKNGEFLDDKTIQVSPALTGENLVHIFWKSVDNPGGPISMTLGDYALRMEFGKLQQGVISGKIFVCLPDDDHSFVAGKFSVGGPGDAGLRWSEISGRVKILDNGEKHVINVACLGKSPTGQLEVPSTGLELPPEFTGTKCSSWKPRDTSLSWDKQIGLTHKHVNRPAGHYLIYLHGPFRNVQDGFWDFCWVNLKDDRSKAVANLTLDSRKLGTLKVSVPREKDQSLGRRVTYLPLDREGRLPLAGAHQYMSSLIGLDLVDGKATIEHLREGRYQVAFGEIVAEAVVVAGRATQVELVAP